MNVLILNPPVDNFKIVREGRCMQRQEAWGTSWPPLTLAIIASVLRNAGFIVSLKDCSNDSISFTQLKHIIQDFKPNLIIANTATLSINGDLKVADLAKEIDEHIKTVFFGIHVTALAEEVFKENPNVELIVDAEPEYTLRDLALALRERLPLSQVKGLIYRVNDKIIRNEKRPLIENLDELPYPAWDLININGYRLPISNRPLLLVGTGRGCPNPCTFCVASVFYGKKIRIRSWRKIVDEIKYVREKYNVNDFLFWAENGITNRQHMHDISQGLAAEVPGLKWVCNGRVDIADEELLKTMKRAGCWMIGYGVEAGTQRVLNLMKKNVKIEDIEKAIQLTKKVGIEVTAHVIVGYPGETKDEILNTLKLLKRLDPHYAQVYCCVPFPGSFLYEELKKLGWLQSSNWSMFAQNLSVINSPELSCQEVMALRRKITGVFYLNPRKILKTLIRVRSIRECASLLSFAKEYFSSWVRNRNS